jgi:uncharacterized protein
MSVHVQLTLSLLADQYVLCRLDPYAGVPAWGARGDFWSITRNNEEITVMCPVDAVPDRIECEKGWRTLQLEGPMSFSQTGILDSVVEPLSHAGVAILVFSAFDTNYVALKEEQLDKAMAALHAVGHTVKQ